MFPLEQTFPRTPSALELAQRGSKPQQVALRPLASSADRRLRENIRRSVIPLDDTALVTIRGKKDTLPKRGSVSKSRSIPELWKLENIDFFRESDFDSFGSSCDDPVQAFRDEESANHVFREQPIFSTKAHVFHIDPKTKRSWIPASSHAVTVSFFYDASRSLYRIISVEGSKPVINSSIAPSMTFTKTSQKFGQWSDIRANTVYGLGFQTEADLNLFIEKFQEVKDKTRFVQQKQNGNSSNSPSSTLVRGGSGTASSQAAAAAAAAAHAAPGSHQAQASAAAAAAAVLEPANEDSPKHKPVSQLPQSTVEAQLRYENDRLKLALAQSSANAKKWEIELQTLKNNNARLTCALQESTANVEEWKRQLQSLKDDNTKLRCRVLEYEASHGNQEAVSELGAELNQLRQRNEYLNAELSQRDKDLESLRSPSAAPSDRVKAMLAENDTLRMSVSRLQEQLESVRITGSKQPALEQLSTRLGMQIAELRELHVELASLLLVPPPQSHGQAT